MEQVSIKEGKKKVFRWRPANPKNPYHVQGDILRRLRFEMGISSAEEVAPLIGAVGYDVQTYRAWEAGRKLPNHTQLKDLADFYNVSEWYLRGELGEYRTIQEKEICELTGLSPEVVRRLIREKEYYDHLEHFVYPGIDCTCFSMMDFINSLVTSDEYENMLMCFLKLCETRLREELLKRDYRLDPVDHYSEIKSHDEGIKIERDRTGDVYYYKDELRKSFLHYVDTAIKGLVTDDMVKKCIEAKARG